MMTLWSKQDEDWLIANYPILGKLRCAKELGRSEQQVRSKTSRLGLKQSKDSEFHKEWIQRSVKSRASLRDALKRLVRVTSTGQDIPERSRAMTCDGLDSAWPMPRSPVLDMRGERRVHYC